MIPISKVSDQTRQRVHTLSNGTVVTQALGTLCFPTFSLLFSRSPGWQLLNQPFLLYVFFSFHSSFSRFPHRVYNYFTFSCGSSPFLRPLQFRPRSRPCSPPRFRTRSHLVLFHPPQPPFLFPLHVRPRLRSCPRSRPRPRSLLLVSRTRLPPRYDARVRAGVCVCGLHINRSGLDLPSNMRVCHSGEWVLDRKRSDEHLQNSHEIYISNKKKE